MDHLKWECVRRLRCLSIVVLYFGCACQPVSDNAAINPWEGGSWIDLSYPFDQSTIYWPTDSSGFQLDTIYYGMTEKDYFYTAYGFSSAEHGGTHLDAPIHFAEGGKSVEALSLNQLMGFVSLIDVREKAGKDRDYLVGVEDFLSWESENGKLPDGTTILLLTGYGSFWPNRGDYLGTEAMGADAVPLLHFPGLDPEAAHWLINHRKIKAIGLDTPSIDYGQSELFQSHRILFEHDIPVFENLANLDKLSPLGSWLIALPMKISGGSGAPLRAVAWVPNP